jgi:hypothetical protein
MLIAGAGLARHPELREIASEIEAVAPPERLDRLAALYSVEELAKRGVPLPGGTTIGYSVTPGTVAREVTICVTANVGFPPLSVSVNFGCYKVEIPDPFE